MKMPAAVLWEPKSPWSVEEVELADPLANEVRVKLVASGLCHSDEHLITGDLPAPLPIVGGHEGSGIVEAVGPGVTSVTEGDHVVLSFIPACGVCDMCSTGHQNLCVLGAHLVSGVELAGGQRITARGQGVGTFCLLGTFAPYVVAHESSVVKINDSIPLQSAALVGCGVTTGVGSAINTAKIQPGDTVAVVGVGGIGMNAVQGARLAGAGMIIAIDPNAWKRNRAYEFGATHDAPSMAEAKEMINDLSWGTMANAAIMTPGVVEGSMMADALALVGKNGRVVVTGLASAYETEVAMSLLDLTLYQKSVYGSLFGSANPRADIPRLLSWFERGDLKLDELVTKTYSLEEINQGYADMRDGANIRGMVLYDA
ncbi:MAG: NDMA-dependent alcohol dehydrogenase [Ferrimicrobium sp.]|jgi:S-(hydroxymethyl)glutathione dehydrogenase/alcohol dehydrogenase|nr:NDMA-dependent alcohol dehydrogenase [Ferrimicrobium sp.]